MDWVLEKNRAMKDLLLAETHHKFLTDLTLDNQLRPLYKRNIACIDTIFEFIKK